MRKQSKFMLISLLIISMLLSSVACAESTPKTEPETEPQPITLTTDNFENYFKINIDCSINEEKHYVPKSIINNAYTYYTATAELQINIYPIKSIEADTVKVEVNFRNPLDRMEIKWESQTVEMFLDDTGRISKSITLNTKGKRDKDELTFTPEYKIYSVSGSVKEK